jgi:hypothetical protein
MCSNIPGAETLQDEAFEACSLTKFIVCMPVPIRNVNQPGSWLAIMMASLVF